MRSEIQVGFRYHSVCVLAALAFKANVPIEKLKEDVSTFLTFFNQIENSMGNEFTQHDISAALTMYHEKNVRLSLRAIETKTGVSIKRNKRNGRSRQEHLELLRTKQQNEFIQGKN